jgi:glycosyltransferase involved in cell wall biosynthesis
MFVFIIPIKNKKISTSWELLSQLFERCLQSICNQTSPNFRVVVVCNEKPDTQFDRPEIHYVIVDFPPPISQNDDERSTGYQFGWSDKISKQNADKARRILKGLEYAERFQPSHFLVVDGDDCVNKHLVEFVEKNDRVDGWFFKKGYVYQEGKKFLWLNLKTFNHVCGTCLIMRYNLRDLVFTVPDCYNHFSQTFTEADVRDLPFIGATYSIGNGENIFMSSNTQTEIKGQVEKRGILFLAKKVFKYRFVFLTKSIAHDFGLYSVGVK